MTSDPKSRGFVSLVGAGPGDPGLITVRGRQRLQEAEVVIYDRLAGEELMRLAPPDAEQIYVGKQPGRHSLTQEEINHLLVERGLQGKRVCRLKGGDPFVFGRGGEEALACREAGILYEIVPGVTSAIAAPAYAGIPVTHRQVAASFAVVTGHEDPARSASGVDWERLATSADTLVFLMGVENLPRIASELMRHGRPPHTPAALVEWGTHPRQRVVVSTLDDIAERAVEERIQAPAVTIVGEVVGLRERLAWFDRRPLFGRRVLVTRSREQASDLVGLLGEAGAQVLEYPTVRIRPFELSEAPHFAQIFAERWDWVLFTSVNAVRCFFNLVREAGGDARSVGATRIAAVGPVTAAAVASAGLRVDYLPQEATSAHAVEEFPEGLEGRRILIPRARVAPDEMPDALRRHGARVEVVPVYETMPDEGSDAIRQAVASGGVDFVTFTSSSTVRNFLELVPAPAVPAGVRIVCIGPQTARTAVEGGLAPSRVAAEHTIRGVVEAILELTEEETAGAAARGSGG